MGRLVRMAQTAQTESPRSLRLRKASGIFHMIMEPLGKSQVRLLEILVVLVKLEILCLQQ